VDEPRGLLGGGIGVSGVSLAPRIGSWPGRLTRRLDRLSEGRFALVAFLPAAIPIALFVIPPIIAVFAMSLFRIEVAKDDNVPFGGLRNCWRALADADFLASVPRWVGFGVGARAICVPLGRAGAL